MKDIFLLEIRWIDSFEKHLGCATGWKIIGYVNTEEDARKIIEHEGFYSVEEVGRSWVLESLRTHTEDGQPNDNIPKMRYTKVQLYFLAGNI